MAYKTLTVVVAGAVLWLATTFVGGLALNLGLVTPVQAQIASCPAGPQGQDLTVSGATYYLCWGGPNAGEGGLTFGGFYTPPSLVSGDPVNAPSGCPSIGACISAGPSVASLLCADGVTWVVSLAQCPMVATPATTSGTPSPSGQVVSPSVSAPTVLCPDGVTQAASQSQCPAIPLPAVGAQGSNGAASDSGATTTPPSPAPASSGSGAGRQASPSCASGASGGASSGSLSVEYLVVGGGGGGGGSVGGGGGGGGVQAGSLTLAPGSYPVVVGSGGAGGAGATSGIGGCGGASSFAGVASIGGGYGGASGSGQATYYTAGSGGSGGGSGYGPAAVSGGTGTPGQGNAGGAEPAGYTGWGTGGGGASQAGSAGSAAQAGAGGQGLTSSITGAAVVYGSGGGGGQQQGYSNAPGPGGTNGGAGSLQTGNPGLANTGGGGGAGGYDGNFWPGGAGGAGVVIIRYLTGSMSATGCEITTSGAYTIHRCTTSATFTAMGTAPSAAAASIATPYQTSVTASLPVTGAATSAAIQSAPNHGTAATSGLTLTFTPAIGYIGADSFTYTATGPGGTSSPATISVTVQPPGPPVAQSASLTTTYQTPVTGNLPVSGLASAASIQASPGHGAATINGLSVTYTPAAGFYGSDGFTYTASGPGGTSTPGTVAVTVQAPAAPVAIATSISVAYQTPGSTALTASGLVTAFGLASQPTHGAATLSGSTVTYTPSPGFYGTDTFTFTAVGPGGTSAPATVSVTVQSPPLPVAQGLTLQVPYGGSASAQATTTSAYDQLVLLGQPTNGLAATAGNVVGYTASYGFTGQDSFQIAAVGAAGQGPAATVSVIVGPPPPPMLAGALIATALASPVTYTFGGASQITGYSLVTAPRHGTAVISGASVTYTPDPGFQGTDVLQVQARGPGGASGAATLAITVGRPGFAPAGGGR